MILGAVPAGLLTGLLAWSLAGGLSVQAHALESVEPRLASLPQPRTEGRASSRASAAPLLGSPLFALTTGPGAVREPAIRVDGVAVTRRRQAALLAIDGQAAAWWEVGASRDGVTLQAVSSTGVTLETAVGVKTLNLGDQSAASAPAAGGVAAAALDQPPPGVRLPPEPASAPRAP